MISLLEQHFGQLVDYQFTARMEDDLDRIAVRRRGADRLAPRASTSATADDVGLKALVTDIDDIDARAVNTLQIGDGIALRVGRYGPYVERGEERASVPDDLAPDELTVAKAEELLSAPSGDRSLGVASRVGSASSSRKNGRYGPYVTEVLEEGSTEKPRTSSLFKTMSPETVTLEDAVRCSRSRACSAPTPPAQEVTAQNGRYGPYVKKGTESRSLESEEQLLTVTLDEALALLAQPKPRRGRGAAKPPLKELGPDPVSGKPMVVKEGRFGPYVTDGETNASLPRGDEPGVAHDRARGPSSWPTGARAGPRRRRRRKRR